MRLLNQLAQFVLAGAGDALFCQLQYLRSQGRWPDLNNPRTFNEQIQWLKVHYRDPLLKICADKFTVREFVEGQGLPDHLIPLLAVYDNVEALDFASLPDRFILKVSHGSGMNLLCRDKSVFNQQAAREKIRYWMKEDFSLVAREWAYAGLTPRIVCEEFICQRNGEPPWDYKFHCFAGEPRYVQVDYGRFTNHTRGLYDADWNRLPCELEYTLERTDSAYPRSLPEMLQVARSLARPFPYVRVDLYEVDQKVYFGELTFYPGRGVERFRPRRFDQDFGQWLEVRDGSLQPRRNRGYE